jgi:thiamine pyrophosphate-dependent acetolactate synthase large subunit-like protein
MKVGEAVATILRSEGVEVLFAYPVNSLIEFAAAADIRPIIVRQERVGLHMADALARVSSGHKIGVFCMQHGPGAENAFGGVAQAYAESVPLLVIPQGYPRRLAAVDPNFSAAREMRGIAKATEWVGLPSEIPAAFRRAFARLRNGRGGPVVVEIPSDLWQEEVPAFTYRPPPALRTAPDPRDAARLARLILAAERPLIYAGTGIHWAEAWDELRRFAERIAAPVATSLGGKSAFPEDHPLALGAGGISVPLPLAAMLERADLVIGLGCSFTETSFGIKFPPNKRYLQITLDPHHLAKDLAIEDGMLGDAKLCLIALLEAIEAEGAPPREIGPVAEEIAALRSRWWKEWEPILRSDAVPLTPYRVIFELSRLLDPDEVILTHDAGSPRDQLVPFWTARRPLSYLGWGKTTQLGYGLGLAMGAKLARPDKIAINVWGDAAIGFTGLDLETAVRERIPILSILFNNFSMAIELKVMPLSTAKYRATDISGDYAALARALGAYGERVERPEAIRPALERGVAAVRAGRPALLEFITAKETRISRY